MDEKRRKKWTPVEAPDESVLKLREKRKWQIALRRYIIEENKCVQYAPYFGLDIQRFRAWIAAQFHGGLNWANFSTHWQFDHIISVNYFDFHAESDLRLCWHFTNIRVNDLSGDNQRFDLLSARRYFEELFRLTNYAICKEMIKKIEAIQLVDPLQMTDIAGFITNNQDEIEILSEFGSYEFQRLNEGTDLAEVLAESRLLKNFG